MPDVENPQRFQITPDWRSCLFALLTLPVLLSLGYWQLDRADEKAALNLLYQQRQQAQPVPLAGLDRGGDLRYQSVLLEGAFVNNVQLLLDNRMHQRQFGYEIITPFKLRGSEQWVLVNRGWVAGDKSRRQLPAVPVIEGSVQLEGRIYVPLGKPLLLGEPQLTPWPRVVQHLDIEALAEELGESLFPYSVRLDELSPGALASNWVVVNMQPEKHNAYAFQWFAMAAAVLVIVLVMNTNIVALLKRRP